MSTNTEPNHWQPYQVKLIDGNPVAFRDVCVHEIRIGDVEDPDMYVAGPIWEWQQTDAGRFIMEHAVSKPYWTQYMDYNSFGLVYRIIARLSEQNELFWKLKWDQNQR